MLIAHKIALDPNNVQSTYFAKAADTARFAYNWALGEWNRQYDAHKIDPSLPRPTQAALRRQLNSIKQEQFPWILEVTKCAPQAAIIQLGQAFQNFFAGRAELPRFKKKGSYDRFTLSNDVFAVDGSSIRIPRLGRVRMRETLRITGKIMSATISRTAGRWFASITVDTPDAPHPLNTADGGTVGVDLGISALATLSTEERLFGPKPRRAQIARVRRLDRSLSRKQKGSANSEKAKKKLEKLHARIANIRNDALHKVTTKLTRRFQTFGIENLNVRGMTQKRRFAGAISDMGFCEFRRQLQYKAKMRGGIVFVADRWFASSKICSACGHKLRELPLATRAWTCPDCGAFHDRDLNAAINLKNMAVSSTASACGEEGSGPKRNPRVKPASTKQEADIEPA